MHFPYSPICVETYVDVPSPADHRASLTSYHPASLRACQSNGGARASIETVLLYPFPTDFSIVPGTLVARLFCAFASNAFLALLPTLEPSQ
jgi:hypothetical protein